MFGINAEKWVTKKVVTAREKFEDAGIYDLNLATGTQGNGGGKTHNGTYSYIARLNYNYAEKYMVELMGRRDGNSKFAPVIVSKALVLSLWDGHSRKNNL